MEEQNQEVVIDQASERPSRIKYIWTYAVISAMIFIILLLITHIFREQLMEKSNMMSIAYFVILLFVILFAQLKMRKVVYGGVITYSQSFSSGLLVGVFSAFMYAIFAFIFYQFIAPEVLDEMVAYAEQQMREKGTSDEMIETAMKYTKLFITPLGILITTIFSHSLMATIASLITSLFTQRSR